MKVTVYSTPVCVQCKMTTRELDKRGVAYDVVDLSKDEVAMMRMKALGFMQAPIVEVGDERWSGFQPSRIQSLVAESIAA